jgi:hypothetical protein
LGFIRTAVVAAVVIELSQLIPAKRINTFSGSDFPELFSWSENFKRLRQLGDILLEGKTGLLQDVM